MTNPEVRYVTTKDGVRIGYTVEGEGPPVVSLRGWLASGVDRAIRDSARGNP